MSNWHDLLSFAEQFAYGDPITGGCYRLRGGVYELHENGKVRTIGDQVAIAFDASTNIVITHGAPAAVEDFGSKARVAYSQREDDINQLPATLVIIRMPRGFSEDDINRSLANPYHLVKIIKDAEARYTLEAGTKRMLPEGSE